MRQNINTWENKEGKHKKFNIWEIKCDKIHVRKYMAE